MNTSSSKRRQRHHDADLATLLTAAEKVFSERGFHATSIRDVATEAGFSVGGVYQFFEGKEQLYARVLEGQWEHFFALLNEANKAPQFSERLLRLTDAMFRAYEERRGFFRLFLSERGRLPETFSGEIAERIGLQTRRLRAHLVELMRQGVAEGCLRDVGADMLASAYIGIVHNCIFEAMSAGLATPQRSAADVLSVFLGGASHAGPTAG